MTLSIDVGGTKTIVAKVNDNGEIIGSLKFETSQNYLQFLDDLKQNIAELNIEDRSTCVIGLPGNVDRAQGIFLTPGNLPWGSVPIRDDVAKLINGRVYIENDANLAGLSESMLLKDRYRKVLYLTVSTGIGSGIIVDQKIDETLIDSEPGHMSLEHDGSFMEWEDFASGRFIFDKFGKYAKDIDDTEIWNLIAKNIAAGLIVLIPIIQPQVIIIGGSIGSFFAKYREPLLAELARLSSPNAPIPEILQAQRPNDAVIYGCYDLAMQQNN